MRSQPLRFRRPRARSTSGFTLIEVLLALSLLSVGIVTVIGSLHNSLGTVSDARSLARVQALCEELLAGWRIEVPDTGAQRGSSNEGKIRWELAVEGWSPDWLETEANPRVDSHYRSGLRMATLTLRWRDGLRERTLTRQEILFVDSLD